VASKPRTSGMNSKLEKDCSVDRMVQNLGIRMQNICPVARQRSLVQSRISMDCEAGTPATLSSIQYLEKANKTSETLVLSINFSSTLINLVASY
jgi:hypothetical protein